MRSDRARGGEPRAGEPRGHDAHGGDRRNGEEGLSLIEALVIVTVTALIAALLLPLVSRTTGRNYALADRALDAAALAEGERGFRVMLRGVQQPVSSAGAGLHGQAREMTFLSSPATPEACAAAGGAFPVRIRIVARGDGERLVCDSGGLHTEMARWTGGAATFSYSDDGVAWAAFARDASPDAQTTRGGAAPATHVAAFVRFALESAEGQRVVWTERVGWTEATIVDPRATARAASAP